MSDPKKSRRSSSSNSQSGTVSNRRDRKIRKYIFLGLAALAVIGVIYLGFHYGNRINRKQRALASAVSSRTRKNICRPRTLREWR